MKKQITTPSDEAIQQAMKDLSMGIIATIRDNIMKMIQDWLIYPAGLVEAMQERINELEAEVAHLEAERQTIPQNHKNIRGKSIINN